jgi:dTDP-4-dehydrorhamnose reductase
MEKLLITGASGFLGWHICQLAQTKYDVYGTYFSKAIEIPGVKLTKVNIADFQELKQLFDSIQPSAIIHTAALSQPNFCQNNPEVSHAINVRASCNIAELCAENSVRYAFTSTDLVFDGKNAPYQEIDAVNPVNLYGEQKALAEQEILGRYPSSAVCRMPLMFGNSTPTATSFMQGFMQSLNDGKDINLFIDEFRTPASANTAAKGILLALEQVCGMIHLGGRERVSRYDFGRLMAEVFQLSTVGLKSCRQKDVQMSAPRPADVSLDSSKAFALGYDPLPIKQELQEIAKVSFS